MDTREKLIEVSKGIYVEADALRIAEKIQEYDPNLRLKYCANPDSISDAPYMLVELCRDGIERVVFYIWELDDRVIDRLHQADNQRLNVISEVEAANALAKKESNRRYKELHDEATEIAGAIAKSPKETYKLTDPYTGKKLKVHQHKPVEVEEPENE